MEQTLDFFFFNFLTARRKNFFIIERRALNQTKCKQQQQHGKNERRRRMNCQCNRSYRSLVHTVVRDTERMYNDCATQRTHTNTHTCSRVANQLNNTQSLWYAFLLCFSVLSIFFTLLPVKLYFCFI